MTLRRARASDVEVLVELRRRMFIDMGREDTPALRHLDSVYRRWLRPRLRRGKVAGVLAVDGHGEVQGGGCVWFRENPPRPDRADRELPYLMSIYTFPAWRRRGVGRAVTLALVELARAGGYTLVALHASDAGKKLYQRLGFEVGREMRLTLDRRRSGPRRVRSASRTGSSR